jgi:hypothetical protein
MAPRSKGLWGVLVRLAYSMFVEDSIAADSRHGYFLLVRWLRLDFLLQLMCLTRCRLGKSHTPKFPCEGMKFTSAGIFL